jgi:hypothetical protein
MRSTDESILISIDGGLKFLPHTKRSMREDAM